MTTVVLEHLQHANSASPDLTVGPDGNIGIGGVAAPSADLEIKPTGSDGELKITSDANGGNNMRLYQGYNSYINASNNVYISAGGNTDMFNLVNGKVGIGTGSPQQELDIQTGQISVRSEQASAGGTGDAGAVNNLIHLRMPYGVAAGSVSNASARVGIKFTGRNDNNGWGADDGKSAAIYGVSEDGLGYNRQVGMAFYTSPFDGAQVERMRIDNNGRVTTPYQPGFRAFQNADYTHPSGNVNLSSAYGSAGLWTKDFDNQNNFSTGTGLFTAPVTGMYSFSAGLLGASNTSNITYFSCEFLVNGSRKSIHWFGNIKNGTSGYSAANNASTFKLAAGDTVGIHCELNATQTLHGTGAGGYGFFSGHLVG